MATSQSRTTTKKVVVRKSKKETAHEYKSYIPDPEVAERYVHRKVWGVQDSSLANIAMREAKNMILMGDTGAGKTLFGEAFASKWRLPYYSLPCDVSIDPSALFGRMQPTETVGKFAWQDGPVSEIARNGGVLNISEGNFMPPKIAASTYPMLDGRRYLPLLGHGGEIVRIHVGTKGKKKCWCNLSAAECNKRRVLIIMDFNPNYRGTVELNAAFYNRFDFKIPWGYDDTVEAELVQFPTLRTIVAELRGNTTEVETPVSTNMMMEFEEFAFDRELGMDFAIENFCAAFKTDERDAVKKVFDLNKDELNKDKRYVERNRRRRNRDDEDTDDDLEEIDVEFSEED